MCKLFALTNASQITVTPKLLCTIKAAVTEHDNHGFGFTLLTNSGLYGERTIMPSIFKPLATRTASSLIVPTSNSFGVKPRSKRGAVKSLIAHGRYSTNTVSLPNTHPYNTDDNRFSLMHNGVVYDTSGIIPRDSLRTNNDTELLLRAWEQDGISGVQQLGGYYAVLALDATTGVLHVVRDSSAGLYISWSPTIQSYIIATTAGIIKAVASAMEWSTHSIEKVDDNQYAQFKGNVIISQETINPKPRYTTTTFTEAERKALDLPASSVGVSVDSEDELYNDMGVEDWEEPAYRRRGA